MKLASLKSGSAAGRDGHLVVVSNDLAWYVLADEVAPTLQAALDNWDRCEPMLRALAHWQPLPMSAFVTLMQWTSRTCGSAGWEVCPQVLLLHFGSAESHARAVWPLVCLFNSGPNLRLKAEWTPESCLHRMASCCKILLLQPSSLSDRRLQHSHREFYAS